MEEKIEALVLCYSEAPFSYSTSHQDLYVDVCGVKPLWRDFLVERGLELNSVTAGYEIYRYYLEKTDSPTEALKKFKGLKSPSKMWIVRKVKRVTKEVKEIYKDELNN